MGEVFIYYCLTSKVLFCYFQYVYFVCVLGILGCLRVTLLVNNRSSWDIHVAPQGSKDLISTERYELFLFSPSVLF